MINEPQSSQSLSNAWGASPAAAICLHSPCDYYFLRRARRLRCCTHSQRWILHPNPPPATALRQHHRPCRYPTSHRCCGPAAFETTTERAQDGGDAQPCQAVRPVPTFPQRPQAWPFRRPVTSPASRPDPHRHTTRKVSSSLEDSQAARLRKGKQLAQVTQPC